MIDRLIHRLLRPILELTELHRELRIERLQRRARARILQQARALRTACKVRQVAPTRKPHPDNVVLDFAAGKTPPLTQQLMNEYEEFDYWAHNEPPGEVSLQGYLRRQALSQLNKDIVRLHLTGATTNQIRESVAILGKPFDWPSDMKPSPQYVELVTQAFEETKHVRRNPKR